MKKVLFTLAIGFATMSCSDRAETVMTAPETISSLSSTTAKGGEFGVVATFAFTPGRKSKNCRGFGICQIVAFGISIIALPEQPKAVVSVDEEGRYSATYLLTAPSSLEDSTFYIDEDFYQTDEENTNYIIKAGEYSLDNSLGKFGGYKINVVKL